MDFFFLEHEGVKQNKPEDNLSKITNNRPDYANALDL